MHSARFLQLPLRFTRLLARRWDGFRRLYWQLRARDIDSRYAADKHDHALVGRLIELVQARTLIDVGCGTGRLFPVYLEHGLQEIVGQDVSGWALEQVRQRFPQGSIKTTDTLLQDLRYPPGHFDLAICSRVLSAIPPHGIAQALAIVASFSKHVYLNELTASDGSQTSDYWFLHDYDALLRSVAHFTVLEEGAMDDQAYRLVRIDALLSES